MDFVAECSSFSFPGALVVVRVRHAAGNAARSGYRDGAKCFDGRVPTLTPGGMRDAGIARSATDRLVDGSFTGMREANTPAFGMIRSRDANEAETWSAGCRKI